MNTEEKAELAAVFEQFIEGSCNKQELETLQSYFQKTEARAILEELIDNAGYDVQKLFDTQRLINEKETRAPWHFYHDTYQKIRTQGNTSSESILKDIPMHAYNTNNRTPKNRYGWITVIGILTIALPTLWLYHTYKTATPSITLIKENPRGQKSTFTLPDGTTIHLNAESKLTFPKKFTTETREVSLIGEAFFTVITDPNRPFIVRTEGLKTTVLGTAFNIKAFPNENSTITITTGKVKVETGEISIPHPDSYQSSNTSTLTSNQQAIFNTITGQLKTIYINADTQTAWTTNTLLFPDIPLQEAVNILERWYGVSITLSPEILGQCRVKGEFKDQSLERVLQLLQYGKPDLSYEIQGENVMIRGEGCEF